MPRGQAISSPHEALFAATDAVLARSGPDGVASRAITDEAGDAKGVLHNHFGDLDTFLVQYAVSRVTGAFARAERLARRVGERTVVDNLCTTVLDVFGADSLGVADLLSARPNVLARVRRELDHGNAGLDGVERIVAAYLDAEQAAGRVRATTDTAMLAFHLVASAHHLSYVTGRRKLDARRVRPVIASLLQSR